MNLKKTTKYFLLLLVLVVIGAVVIIKTIPLSASINIELNEIIEQYSIVENKTNDKIIRNFPIINEKGETLLLSSLLTSNKLIYRFSELHCDSCIIKEFENLRKCIATEGLKNIIILCYYQNPRNLNIFKRINRLQDFEIYNLVDNNIGELELENSGVPYFFVLNKEFKISNTFIPLKEANQRTDDYLKRVSTLLK